VHAQPFGQGAKDGCPCNNCRTPVTVHRGNETGLHARSAGLTLGLPMKHQPGAAVEKKSLRRLSQDGYAHVVLLGWYEELLEEATCYAVRCWRGLKVRVV